MIHVCPGRLVVQIIVNQKWRQQGEADEPAKVQSIKLSPSPSGGKERDLVEGGKFEQVANRMAENGCQDVACCGKWESL
jgi:hypothetical protein